MQNGPRCLHSEAKRVFTIVCVGNFSWKMHKGARDAFLKVLWASLRSRGTVVRRKSVCSQWSSLARPNSNGYVKPRLIRKCSRSLELQIKSDLLFQDSKAPTLLNFQLMCNDKKLNHTCRFDCLKGEKLSDMVLMMNTQQFILPSTERNWKVGWLLGWKRASSKVSRLSRNGLFRNQLLRVARFLTECGKMTLKSVQG